MHLILGMELRAMRMIMWSSLLAEVLMLALRRFYYINPVAWAIQGLIGSQLGTVNDEYITVTGQVCAIADIQHPKEGWHFSPNLAHALAWQVRVN